MINLQKPLNTSTTMNKDLQAALEIDQMVNDRNYRWETTQRWYEGNLCFPTISTDNCLSRYAIMRIEEICGKYDCTYDISSIFNANRSGPLLQITIMENKR